MCRVETARNRPLMLVCHTSNRITYLSLKCHCCVIEGEIPSWLSGDFIRNGPGGWDGGNRPMRHMFDGYAMLVKVLHMYASGLGETLT